MKRGPRPVDISKLAFEADSLAMSLHELRDGRPGLLVHLKGGVWKTTLLPELREDEVGRPEKLRRRVMAGQVRYVRSRCKVNTLIVPRTGRALKDAWRLVRGSRHWRYVTGVSARPEIWERLKTARSVAEIREIARGLRRPVLCSLLRSHAEGFLRAKSLPHYPKSNRPRSDTKRIQFFAKVLAGLKLGIAPATATKRLARSVLTSGDITKHLNLPDYTEVFKPTQGGKKR